LIFSFNKENQLLRIKKISQGVHLMKIYQTTHVKKTVVFLYILNQIY